MGRVRLIAIVLVVVAAAAAGATFATYGSFDPCEWMAQDLADHRNVPLLVARGEVSGRFLVDGVTDPGFDACMLAWWKFRASEGPPIRP